jgi:alpha-ribazole phosphatase
VNKTLELLRHGEVSGGMRFRGSRDDPLTETGWEQMWAAVASGGPWDEVVSSPLSRCREFASELAGKLGIPCRLDERLREFHFGAWEGRGFSEFGAKEALAVAAFFKDPFRHPPPESEPMEAFVKRVLEVCRDLSAVPGRQTLVVTHGGVIRIMLCHFHAWPLSRMAELEVGHASVHRFSRAGEGPWEEEIP